MIDACSRRIGARIARVEAVVPPAPTMFSMMIGWPSVVDMCSRDDARDDVGRPAGGERHDHGDRTRRIVWPEPQPERQVAAMGDRAGKQAETAIRA